MKSLDLPFHNDSAKVNIIEVSALKDRHFSTFDIQDPDVDVADLKSFQQVFKRDARDRGEGIHCCCIIHERFMPVL